MSNPARTHITILLDRSASMSHIQDDAVAGVNAFVAEQRKAGDATLTLIRFDHDYLVDYANRPVGEAPELTALEPRGRTALHDALGRAIVELRDHLGTLPAAERPEKVVFVVVTDGMENRSSRFSGEQVRDLVRHQSSEHRWQFVYLGTGHDAAGQSGRIGFNPAHTARFAQGSIRHAFAATADNIVRYRFVGDAAQNLGFTPVQRAQLGTDQDRPGDDVAPPVDAAAAHPALERRAAGTNPTDT